jgi:hypothetical protein
LQIFPKPAFIFSWDMLYSACPDWALAIHVMRLANPVGGFHQSAAGFSPPRTKPVDAPWCFGFVLPGTPQRSQRNLSGSVEAG